MVAFSQTNHKHPVREESDERLVDLVRGGSGEAFEAIVLRYRPPLLRHCRRMLPQADAEDAVQETLLIAYRTIERSTNELRLGPWLFRVAHNSALGTLRKHDASATLDGIAPRTESTDDVVIERERFRNMLSAISVLPEAQRRVLVEREFAGRGHREIATSLGRSEGAVRQLLNRARTELRKRAAAVAPLFLRLLPSGGEERIAAAGIGAKGGAIIGISVATIGAGAALLPRTPVWIQPHRAEPRHSQTHAVQPAHHPGGAAAGYGTLRQPPLATASSSRARDGRPDGTHRLGGRSTAGGARHSRRAGSGVSGRTTATASGGSGPAATTGTRSARTTGAQPNGTSMPQPRRASGRNDPPRRSGQSHRPEATPRHVVTVPVPSHPGPPASRPSAPVDSSPPHGGGAGAAHGNSISAHTGGSSPAHGDPQLLASSSR